ncbi:hypothetical protein L3Q67_07855 [Saccharothrix sp. AJ9571]|nr:hypothetical protein L3Q67_07855 [Saccharothrix sp. AJ9571]
MKRQARTLLVVVAAFLLSLLMMNPASAADANPAPSGEVGVTGADHCNYPQWGPVCVNVNGGGLFVADVTASYPHGAPWLVCDKEFHVWGYYENGQQWHRNGRSQCGALRTWVTFSMNANMQNGSLVCADMKADNTWHGSGFACVHISR